MNSQADRQAALDYHEFPTPGKISVVASKPLPNQRDLALAYSPGVAAACEEIVADPANVFRYTARGNLVGVITNGTAVLGLGNIDVYKRQEWNNLKVEHIVIAIFVIGIVGLILETLLVALARRFTYTEE